MMVFHETSSSLLYHTFRVFLYIPTVNVRTVLLDTVKPIQWHTQ